MNRLKSLLDYYVECIEIESLEEFSLPSFKLDQAFINVPLNSEWSSTGNAELTITPPSDFRKSVVLGGQTSTIYYGWPVYCTPKETRDGKPYAWIEPMFLLKVVHEQNGTQYDLTLQQEWPKINDRILKRFASTVEERIQVIDTIGLSEADELPDEGLIVYWTRFCDLYQEITPIEEIDPPHVFWTDFSDIETEGFHNRCILIAASAPHYSRQLLRELRLMKEPSRLEQIDSTSLGAIIRAKNDTHGSGFQLSQITRLNRSQRRSVSSAFSNRISVVTGPPGTGKSQVVLNLLGNAFENNKTVLFTSKNNKAVDVVCERILKKVNFPINLRLGARTQARDYTTEFLDLLDLVLSGGDRETIETEYRRTKEHFEEAKSEYFSLLEGLEDVIAIRNKIDQLDQEIEKLEKKMDKATAEKAEKVKFRECDFFGDAKAEVELLNSDKWPFFYKVFGLFEKSLPYRRIHGLCTKCNSVIGELLPLPSERAPELKEYADFVSSFPDIYQYIRLFNEISDVRVQLTSRDINDLSKKVELAERDFIDKAVVFYEWMGKKRMLNLSSDERNSLTSYYSVIRQLIGEQPGSQAYAKLIRRQISLFDKISKILPVWSVTNLSAGGRFPLTANCFDLVVIDEASQSDIASAFPLLYRAKNAVVIGDPQQLPHVSSVRKQQNNRLMAKYDLIEDEYLRFSYSTQSLYHCARGAVGKDNVTLLNEHYRSHFSIIEFSNEQWYTGNLDIRTNYDNLIFPPDGRNHIEWIDVVGNVIRPNNTSALNTMEANRVVEVLGEILDLYGESKPSVGIVTPFAAQAEFFRDKLINIYSEEFIKDHFLIADTAHKFQGDERDIMIFSPVISRGVTNDSTTVGFLRRTSNLFNVSITRARSILWVVGDRKRCLNIGIPFLKGFVEYIETRRYENIDLPYGEFQSPWEKKFFEALVAEGLEPVAQQQAGPYFIDIAIMEDTSKLAFEVDGERWHTDLTGERLERDIVRDRNLARMGWDVTRFWVHDLKYDLQNCLSIVQGKLKREAQ